MHRSSNWQNCHQTYSPKGWSIWQNCCAAELLADILPNGWSVWQNCCVAELLANLPSRIGPFHRTAVWQNCQQIYPPQLVSLAELPADLPSQGLVNLAELLCSRTADRYTPQWLVSLAELLCGRTAGKSTLQDWSISQNCCVAELSADLPSSVGQFSRTASRPTPQVLVSLAELLCSRTAGTSSPKWLVSLAELLCGRTAGKSTP